MLSCTMRVDIRKCECWVMIVVSRCISVEFANVVVLVLLMGVGVVLEEFCDEYTCTNMPHALFKHCTTSGASLCDTYQCFWSSTSCSLNLKVRKTL